MSGVAEVGFSQLSWRQRSSTMDKTNNHPGPAAKENKHVEPSGNFKFLEKARNGHSEKKQTVEVKRLIRRHLPLVLTEGTADGVVD